MNDTVRVLVVDDNDDVRKGLKLYFEESERFRFDVTCVADPAECVELEEANRAAFDVCVVDLGFDGRAATELIGHNVVVGLSCIREGGVAVVYSGFPTIPNIVRAVRLGAADFVSKAECPPHKLVERIESLLVDREEHAEERRKIIDFVHARQQELRREYAGRVLALVVEGSGPRIVADGRSRFEALLKYAAERNSVLKQNLPVYPHLHVVPSTFD